jgi:hypothetical protein
MKTVYSFKLNRTLPLLNEEEWAEFWPLNRENIKALVDDINEFGGSLSEAIARTKPSHKGILKYKEMTGITLTDVQQLNFLCLADYGALCSNCGKPFRSPRAHLCAECGYTLPKGETAGPLTE